MYRTGQAHEVMRLLSERRIVLETGDLDVTRLEGLPAIQQKMLDGRMTKPKGVALVQSVNAGHKIAEFEAAYLGQSLRTADPRQGRYLSLSWCDGVVIATIRRPDALNALNEDLLAQLEAVIDEIAAARALDGHPGACAAAPRVWPCFHGGR